MDVLPRFCVSAELSKDEFLRRLCSAPEHQISLSKIISRLLLTGDSRVMVTCWWGAEMVVVVGSR